MSTSANVRSIEAIRDFRVAILKYVEEAGDAITQLRMQVRRVQQWLDQDRPAFWREQVTRGWTRVSEARANLEMCQTRRVAGERPSCHDEKVALEKAKKIVERAEQLIDVVRMWSQQIQHESLEYEGSLGQFETYCQVDLGKAVGMLDRVLASLERYAELSEQTDDSPSASSSDSDKKQEKADEIQNASPSSSRTQDS